jgi:hypothetical protein
VPYGLKVVIVIPSSSIVLQILEEIKNLFGKLKMIWEICTEGQETLKTEATNYFKTFFRDQDPPLIVDQVKVVSLFNRFITEDEATTLFRPS